MVVPVGEQAAQQVGSAQERGIADRGAAKDEMITTAGAGMPAVEHEFLAREARQAGRLVQVGGAPDEFVPTLRGMNVHLDDAGVRRDPETVQPWIARGLVTLQHDRLREIRRRRFHRRHQFQVGLQPGRRRHENIQHAVARLSAHRGPGDRSRRFVQAGCGTRHAVGRGARYSVHGSTVRSRRAVAELLGMRRMRGVRGVRHPVEQ